MQLPFRDDMLGIPSWQRMMRRLRLGDLNFFLHVEVHRGVPKVRAGFRPKPGAGVLAELPAVPVPAPRTDFTAARRQAKKEIAIHAGLAGANGFNPIPGLDFSVDTGLAVRLQRRILECYGFRPDHPEFLASGKEVSPQHRHAVRKLLRAASMNFVLKMTKRSAAAASGRTLIKWIPIAGSAAAASWNAGFMSYLGQKLIRRCEQMLKDMGEVP